MNILENAKNHFGEISGTLRKVEVHEWGDDSGPAIIYASPMNLEQRSKVHSLANEGKLGESFALKIYFMSKNEDGTRVFNRSDTDAFLKNVDPNVISDVVSKLDREISTAGIEKN